MKTLRTLLLTLLCTMPLMRYATADEMAGNQTPSDTQSAASSLVDNATQTPVEISSEQTLGTLTLAPELLTSDGSLDLGKVTYWVPFKVNYPSFGPGHIVTLRWAGTTTYATAPQATGTLSPLVFYVPKTTVAATLGSTASVTYTVQIPGAPMLTSEPLNVKVMLEELSPPVAPLADGGKLDVGKAPLLVPFTVAFPSLAAEEKVTLNWKGSTPYNTVPQTTISTAPLVFNVPREIIAKDLGNTATLTYTVEIAGAVPQTSAPLTVQIQFNLNPPPRFPLSTGIEAANKLNLRYADKPEICDNNTPAYYCSGVILRGVADGNFDPWNPSPSATALGAQSFSFVRDDANMKQTFVPSGYILATPADAVKQSKPVRYLCIYPYNAGTSAMTPLGKGCNAAATTQLPADADLSTCASKNATTVDSWLAYIKTSAQCSLSVQDPAQFMTMVGVRAASPGNTAHNELLIETWAQNVPSRLPLEGFFYTSATGFNAARNFQYKFKIRTGEWLPILRLDLTQATPFAYAAEDQWTLP